MRYHELGGTGLSLSAIGFGCGGTGGLFVRGGFEAQCEAAAIALEAGINYFDTAAQYGEGRSEQNLGAVLQHLGADPYVGTKFRIERFELTEVREVARSKLAAGLDRLRRERVDVCTLHTRLGRGSNELRAAEVVGPVADAMHELVATGLAGAVGFSGLGETAELLEVAASGRFDTMQCYFNVLNQSAARPGSPDGLAQDFEGLLQIADAQRLGVFCIRVLAGGALAGGALADGALADGALADGALAGAEHRHPLAGSSGRAMALGEEYEEDRRRAELLGARLGELGATTLPELALRFALGQEGLSTVLLGFSDALQVQAAVLAETRGPLSATARAVLVSG